MIGHGPAPLENAWDEAPASPAPVVPNVKTDPEVSPLPFHITLQQPNNFTSTLVESAIHLPPAHTSPRVRNLECFHDHVWIEHMPLEGAHVQHHCVIPANLPRVGHGLAFVAADAWRFRIV